MKRKEPTHVPYQPHFPVRRNKDARLPSLSEQVDKIVAAYEKVKTDSTQSLKHARECGYLLCITRCLVDHGSWENFVTKRCGMEMRTAQRYMALFRKAPSNWRDAPEEDSRTMKDELRSGFAPGRRHLRLAK